MGMDSMAVAWLTHHGQRAGTLDSRPGSAGPHFAGTQRLRAQTLGRPGIVGEDRLKTLKRAEDEESPVKVSKPNQRTPGRVCPYCLRRGRGSSVAKTGWGRTRGPRAGTAAEGRKPQRLAPRSPDGPPSARHPGGA